MVPQFEQSMKKQLELKLQPVEVAQLTKTTLVLSEYILVEGLYGQMPK
jgi:hypothetical protein